MKWDSEGLANIYRVGHKGKVTAACTVIYIGAHKSHVVEQGVSNFA